jgi:ferredoxin--NADP+ reductase
MTISSRVDPIEVLRLRWQLYNAEVIAIRRVHEDLAVFRVRGDAGALAVAPGQYTLLGLGNWERRDDGLDLPPEWFGRDAKIIRRAYSVTSPILDDNEAIVPIGEHPWLDFYVTCVRRPDDEPPSLTPRLFDLEPGARLFLGRHPKGTYSLDDIAPEDDIVFCATGTGEAPHNAMLAELLARGHEGRIVSAVTVRELRDLAYRTTHASLEARFPQYRYLALTTREPENLDTAHPDFVGKRYLQDVFQNDDLCQELVGFVPRPGRAHFFLCGNPAMIGLPRRDPEGTVAYPEPLGMAELLVRRGFRLEERHQPGDVHFEKYW